MKLKSIALGAIATAAVVCGSFLASAAPAQALIIGGGDTLGLGGKAKFDRTTRLLDFQAATTTPTGRYGTSTGIASVLPGSSLVFGLPYSIADLLFNS